MGTGRQVPIATRTVGGWRQGSAARTAILAVVVAFFLWGLASILSGCSDPGYCDDFTEPQVVARLIVAFSPIWLLVLAVLAFRFRSALVAFAIASIGLALLTLALYTDLRFAFRPVGLSSATGFVLFSIPYAVAGIAACLDLRRH